MKLGARYFVHILILLFGIAAVFNESRAEHPAAVLAGVLLIVCGLALRLLWIRCPNCGKALSFRDGAYCAHCGAKIDWNAK